MRFAAYGACLALLILVLTPSDLYGFASRTQTGRVAAWKVLPRYVMCTRDSCEGLIMSRRMLEDVI